MPKLLVVDDEAIIRHSFRRVFASAEVEVVTAETLAEARLIFDRDQPDVIVLDLQLRDGSGLDFFNYVRGEGAKRPVIFLTAHGTTDTAIEAMKHGAFDYLLKPIDLGRMTQLLEQAFASARLMRAPAELPGEPGGDRIVGRAPIMQEMCKSIGRIAPQDVNVLILGESGTGKELVARALYHHSKRADKPFLAVNCAALPEGLVESELFGHEQGAFTGAQRRRIGKFEQCHDGTIFLDEIGDMPLGVQAKMLRLLQEQQFERVGGNESIATRVRILAATNQKLEQLIAQNKFRNDLYYRLKVVTIRVPPLRERKEDIAELAHHFLFSFDRQLKLEIRGFAPSALDLLQHYDWPGNVRELQGVIKEAMLRTAGSVLQPESLGSPPLAAGTAPAAAPVGEMPTWNLAARIEQLLADGQKDVHGRLLREVEFELLTRALRHAHGHQVQTSELLGISRSTLRIKLREHGIALERVIAERADENAGD
jgi:two-component system, NtrC family, nitrogen regulation response regulator GlnG